MSTVGLDEDQIRRYIRDQEKLQQDQNQGELNFDITQRPLQGAFLIPPALPVVAGCQCTPYDGFNPDRGRARPGRGRSARPAGGWTLGRLRHSGGPPGLSSAVRSRHPATRQPVDGAAQLVGHAVAQLPVSQRQRAGRDQRVEHPSRHQCGRRPAGVAGLGLDREPAGAAAEVEDGLDVSRLIRA